MAYPYKTILCPLQFDDNSIAALEIARRIALDHDATLHVLHVVSVTLVPGELPVVYSPEEDQARESFKELADKRLSGVRHQLLIRRGEPGKSIVECTRELNADLIVLATHGRTGFKRLFIGSVAERVVREAPCAVLTVRPTEEIRPTVRSRMTPVTVTVAPDDSLSLAQQRMHDHQLHLIPVVESERLVGVLSDANIRRYAGRTDQILVAAAMARDPLLVTPETTLEEAAKLMSRHRVFALAVVEDGLPVGIVAATDVLATYVQ